MKEASRAARNGRSDCDRCVHFRDAPYQARIAGCYHPEHMRVKQSARYLDEQQVPGDHERINRNGDCPQFEPQPEKPPLWRRLFSDV